LITEQNEVLERWKEHFEETLYREQPINPVIIHEEECNSVLTGVSKLGLEEEEVLLSKYSYYATSLSSR